MAEDGPPRGSAVDPSSLPYRPGVGIMLLNARGEIWLGRRCDWQIEKQPWCWQMPQGGIDEGEEPVLAVARELWEETGVRSISILAESDWIAYDLPARDVGVALGGRYRGQRQKWFAARFLGDEAEINLTPEGCEQEFDAWRWAAPSDVIGLVVPFKRRTYAEVLRVFARFLQTG